MKFNFSMPPKKLRSTVQKDDRKSVIEDDDIYYRGTLYAICPKQPGQDLTGIVKWKDTEIPLSHVTSIVSLTLFDIEFFHFKSHLQPANEHSSCDEEEDIKIWTKKKYDDALKKKQFIPIDADVCVIQKKSQLRLIFFHAVDHFR